MSYKASVQNTQNRVVIKDSAFDDTFYTIIVYPNRFYNYSFIPCTHYRYF